MKHRRLALALISSLIPLASGCLLTPFFDYDEDEGADGNGFQTCVPWQRAEVDPAGEHSLFVVDSVQFASNTAEATMLGMDFDNDNAGRRDNVLGSVLATVFGQLDIDLNVIVAEMIQDGRILHLIDVQTVDRVASQGVGVDIFLGRDTDGDPSDNFSGSEFFEIVERPEGPAGQTMAGIVLGGGIEAEMGAFPMQIALPGHDEPFVLDLSITRIEADLVGDTLSGTIGGVLSEEKVQMDFLPLVHLAITRHVSRDCTTSGCVPGTNGAQFIDLFDRDDDVQVSLEEVVDNELVRALTAPDLDLFDEDGVLNPGCEGVRESLSFSVSFTAVPAQF